MQTEGVRARVKAVDVSMFDMMPQAQFWLHSTGNGDGTVRAGSLPREILKEWMGVPVSVSVSPDRSQVAFAYGASAVVVNAIVALVEPAEMDRADEDVPHPVGHHKTPGSR
jgi:hypothetical protein